ncbi:MAG: hypothetical protein DWI02_01405 [Planctomycetota bacterium]|nr:MAG: hypothetical protein DWI02_01405 [Planctomycetota bacterium]
MRVSAPSPNSNYCDKLTTLDRFYHSIAISDPEKSLLTGAVIRKSSSLQNKIGHWNSNPSPCTTKSLVPSLNRSQKQLRENRN